MTFPTKQDLEDYFTFLRFPSIATDAHFAPQVTACAQWLATWMRHAGLSVTLWETPQGAPTLFATTQESDKPTLLLYAHYDVQPVDPLHLWTTPPFEPIIRDGAVYARGASDDKGQCFYMLCALRDALRRGPLPFHVKVLIEGEEESGSESLRQQLKTHAQELKADSLLIVDSSITSLKKPSITLGCRGIITLTVTLQEGNTDLHSGLCGGLAINPNRALVHLLSQLHDPQGRVTLPGFYDAVAPSSQEELASLSLAFDEAQFYQDFGFIPHGMEKGIDPVTATWLRPTLEINGLTGGYGGPGFKTVIPAQASAKISCRLVPNQDPEKICTLLETFFRTHTPPSLRLTLTYHGEGSAGFRSSPHSPFAQRLRDSYSHVFGIPCTNALSGGSLPIAPELIAASAAETLAIGTALATDRIHAPDEHFSLESFTKGYQILYRLLNL